MNRRAFTLIELLVVVAIIAVLAGLLLPAASLVRTKAKQLTCFNRLKQIALGIEGYRNDNEGIYPFCTITDQNDANRPASLKPPNTYPPYAYDPYWGGGGGGLPYLWSALMQYEIVPPKAGSGAMPNDWRCPARQTTRTQRTVASDPWMILNNNAWQANFIWNYPNTFNWISATDARPGHLPEKGYARARLVFDYTIPGWAKKDFMHLDGTINVIYADFHGAKETYDTWAVLNPNQSTAAGELANAWWIDGWRQ